MPERLDMTETRRMNKNVQRTWSEMCRSEKCRNVKCDVDVGGGRRNVILTTKDEGCAAKAGEKH